MRQLRFLFPQRAVQWLGPILLAGAAAFFLAVVVVVSGVVDLSAAKPHPEGWARFLHFTFDRSTAFHAQGVQAPADLDSPVRIAAGAAYFGQVCARCHGGPGLGQNPVVLSMHPRPQYLVRDLKMAGYSSEELFRIVKAGVKYSAMPAWPAERRDDEIWQVVAFLRALPGMSPAQFRELALVKPAAGDEVGASRWNGAPSANYRYALRNDDEPPRAAYAYGGPTYGFVGYAMGGDPIATCARCHGADGAGGGAFPNLTLQDRSYLRRTLAAFAQGHRRSGFMQVIASELSPQQIAALADHYAALPRRATDQANTAPPAIGQQLALRGDPRRGLGACAGCHGVDRAAARAYPVLEGQSAWYIANQLRVFRSGGRGALGGEDAMVAIARHLDDRSIAAVAAYYAAQPPSRVQSFAKKPTQ